MMCATCHKESRMLVRTVIKNVVVNICPGCFKRYQDEAEQAAARDLLEDVMLPGGDQRHG